MTDTTDKKASKSGKQTAVNVIVKREFVGDKTMLETIIPVIIEDLRRKAEQIRTLDKRLDST